MSQTFVFVKLLNVATPNDLVLDGQTCVNRLTLLLSHYTRNLLALFVALLNKERAVVFFFSSNFCIYMVVKYRYFNAQCQQHTLDWRTQ